MDFENCLLFREVIDTSRVFCFLITVNIKQRFEHDGRCRRCTFTVDVCDLFSPGAPDY